MSTTRIAKLTDEQRAAVAAIQARGDEVARECSSVAVVLKRLGVSFLTWRVLYRRGIVNCAEGDAQTGQVCEVFVTRGAASLLRRGVL